MQYDMLRQKMHSTTLFLWIGLASLLIVSCGRPASSSATLSKAPQNQQILVSPLVGLSQLATLDPALVSDQPSAQVASLLYNGLVQLNDQGQVTDILAQSHHVSTDGLSWMFTLRSNLTFSDGTPLTSQDVAYSLNRALLPATKSPVAPYFLSSIKDAGLLNLGKLKTIIGDSILTPSPTTIVIKTSKKTAYFLESLANQTAFVVEKKLVDRYGNSFTDHLNQRGGSGPWILSQSTTKAVEFVPNPHFFGAKPQLRKLVLPFFPLADTSYKAYQANQVDSASVPTTEIAQAKALPQGQYHQQPSLALTFLTMNYLVKPFDNIKIRQAFALAINKDQIATNIYHNSVIATNHIVPEGMPGYNPNLLGPGEIQATTGNSTRAKQLFDEGLQEEGLTRQTLPSLMLAVPATGAAGSQKENTAEQQMWQTTLGVNVRINTIDPNQLLNLAGASTGNPKGLMMWELGWTADYPDPQDWTSLQFGQGAANNFLNYGQNRASNAQQQQSVQQLLAQADRNLNVTHRLQQYQEAEQQLVNDVAWLPLYQPMTTSVMKPCVVGFPSDPLNIVAPDDWGKIYKSSATPCGDAHPYA